MNQKKHLNAIAALEASKDAEPGSLWHMWYCPGIHCSKCYANPGENIKCCGARHISEVRAALQSGLDAYNKRKAEKAERRAIEAANSPDSQTITIPRDPAVWDAEKGPYPVAVTKKGKPDSLTVVYAIENSPSWKLATLAEVLPLIFDGPRQFADEARRQGWKR